MTREYEFGVGTTYVGSTVKEVVRLEFDEDQTEEEIEALVAEYYDEWVWEKIQNHSYWKEMK